MNAAEALYADLRSRGVELETDGRRLRWRPAFLVTAPEETQIRGHRDALIALLVAGHQPRCCRECGRPMDSFARCATCWDRLCAKCAKPTGSYFIRLCILCGRLDTLEQANSTSIERS
jgi:hypothetical protein